MLVALTILSILCCVSSNEVIAKTQGQQSQEACIGFIIRKYFVESDMLTLVDIKYNDDSLLKYIHSMNIISITISSYEHNWRFNQAYMFATANTELFIQTVNMFNKEGSLNPYVRFLVVIRKLQINNLKQIFDTLLELHVYNVVVVNGTDTAELYTYNPFENYACGKYYKRVIDYGKCYDAKSVNLYPVKTVTGLRKCLLKVSCAHWPPYSINPSLIDDHFLPKGGVEQYVVDIMSEIEQFKYKFVFDYDPEMFSVVVHSENGTSVSGPMTMLQSNKSDLMLGGLILTQPRANMFAYVHGYLDQVEEIKLMVKKASYTPPWKDCFIEFRPLVWYLILLAFVLYGLILKLLLRTQNTGRLLLALLDNLFNHGAKIKARQTVEVIFVFWVVFASILNAHYQCILVSRVTMPSLEYQIDDESVLYAHNLKPCVSKVMKTIMAFEKSKLAMVIANTSSDESCAKYHESIETVSRSKDKFTAVLNTVYLYDKLKFYDKYGTSKVHSLTRPFTKVISAMYLYKGFPAGDRLNLLSLRIREAGISDKALENHIASRRAKYHFHSREYSTRFSIPWHVYVVGIGISIVTFVVEFISVAGGTLVCKGKPTLNRGKHTLGFFLHDDLDNLGRGERERLDLNHVQRSTLKRM